MEEVSVLSKRRLKFSKLNMAKYISHLDLLRCFTRSIMRAELPVKYSNGFNPHQKITFSLPLSIGVTSDSEFVDIDFEDGIKDSEIMERLNNNLPPDMRILHVGDIKDSANDIVSAKYQVKIISDKVIADEKVKEFFDMPEYTIMKKTKKKGEQPVNLMDFIIDYSISEHSESSGGSILKMELVLSAGGQKNLKPEIAVKAFSDYLASEINIISYDIHRTEIYISEKEGLKVFE